MPFSYSAREFFGEFVGTFALVFFGPASVIATATIPTLSRIESLYLIAATFGLVVGLMILLLGELSGAAINPAVLIAAVVSGSLKKSAFLPYLIYQVLGGLAAGITLKLLFSSFDTTNLGSTKLASGYSPLAGILIEAAGTFVLACVCLFAGKKLGKNSQKGFLVGATLFFLIIIIGPMTGASFNPARSLGPALFSPYLNNLYVYLIGPSLGGLVAGIVFKAVTDRIERKTIVRVRA